MKQTIQIQPGGHLEEARQGENLLKVLRRANHAPDAPCGGNGKCGKCLVEIEDSKGRRKVLACQTEVWEDMKVHLPKDGEKGTQILLEGYEAPLVMDPLAKGKLLAFDIGTTTVVCYLLSPEDGQELSHASMLNPQESFGADVISRIQCAVKGEREALTKAIREGMESLIKEVCKRAGVSPSEIGVVSVVGNPCMQQLFLGMEVNNLAAVPFAPVLKESAPSSGGGLPAFLNKRSPSGGAGYRRIRGSRYSGLCPVLPNGGSFRERADGGHRNQRGDGSEGKGQDGSLFHRSRTCPGGSQDPFWHERGERSH